jgi:hypothetical protein
MGRYWVNLGDEFMEEDEDAIFDIEELTNETMLKELDKELQKIANHFNEHSYSYVTEDLDEAISITKQAIEIYKKHQCQHLLGSIYITRQRECLSCGYLARFSEEYCPKCGTELAFWNLTFGLDDLKDMQVVKIPTPLELNGFNFRCDKCTCDFHISKDGRLGESVPIIDVNSPGNEEVIQCPNFHCGSLIKIVTILKEDLTEIEQEVE